MPRRPNWRAIKIHRNYTVEEAASKLGVAKGTVLRWVKSRAVPAIVDRRPFLILGQDLIDLGRRRKAERQTCGLRQCYCFSCRMPRDPAAGMADLTPITASVGDLEALCGGCGRIMHKRVPLANTAQLEALLDLTIRPASSRIAKCDEPSLNDDM